MKKFKKIYLEITNQCNLKCPFCIQNKRESKYISTDEFKLILDKIENYTDYLYFHVMGEPLLHPNIKEFIDIANSRFKINITTNGYLIKRIKNVVGIRQINISLHSYDNKYNISLDEYMNNIFDIIDSTAFQNTYISLRFWVKNKYNDEIINRINSHYRADIDENTKNYTINNHIFINNFHEFIWPDLDNEYYSATGTCYALREHIGILADGTVIPCCLDSVGCINLGNIYNSSLEKILNTDRVNNMIDGFKNNIKKEEFCKHCHFIEK